jgi:demethylmenaquinone methyltransferase / 2-methoxy-6-polyprenyl-1,4-benzoquinol methylase
MSTGSTEADVTPSGVRDMFAGIAARYDLLNSILSLARHKAWRRVATRMARLAPGDRALDVCAGTADFTIDLLKVVGSSGYVWGVDFCEPMLRHGNVKLRAAAVEADRGAALALGDALRLPFRDAVFDAATVGFGIRNTANPEQAFHEMARVVRPGGTVVCLEFSRPQNPFGRRIVGLYERYVLPIVGGALSRRTAYTYLHESIQRFHSREELARMMERAGLEDVQVRDLHLGSVCIHAGVRRST